MRGSTVGGQDASANQADRGRRRWALQVLQAYALLMLLGLLVIFFSVYPETSDTFPTAANLRILVSGQAVIAVVALGALIPLIAGEFDISVGAIAALSAVVLAEILSSGMALPLGILIAIGVTALVGASNAVIVTRAGVNGFVTTLGMATVLVGGITHITGGRAVPSEIPAALTDFGNGTILGVPWIFIALMMIAGFAFFVLEHTPFGRQLYALGSNRAAAVLVGVRSNRVRGLTLLIGGILCGVAGVLYVARAGGADPRIATSLTLPALAAAFLSASSVRPGRFNVWGAIVAIYFLAVLNNGLNLAGSPPYISDYLNGLALIAGVALASYFQRRQRT